MFYWATFIKFSLSEIHNIKSNKINYVSPIFLNCQQITAVRKDTPFQNKQKRINNTLIAFCLEYTSIAGRVTYLMIYLFWPTTQTDPALSEVLVACI